MKFLKENKKETQGHRKMKQYLEDLKRNKHFRRDFNKYLKLYKDHKDSEHSQNLMNLMFDKHIKLAKLTKRAIKKDETRWMKAKKIIAEKYNLDYRLLAYLSDPITTKYLKLPHWEDTRIDMCHFVDNYDDNFFDSMAKLGIPLLLDPFKQMHISAYPVSIDIHLFATKRDVLDFIDKRWGDIGNTLLSYSEKNVRIRKRKQSRELLDCIWENQSLGATKIKAVINKKFPNNGLAYWEIHKIVSNERKKRMLKITVGR